MPDSRRSSSSVVLDVGDAAELVEILAFLQDWLGSNDAPALDASLQRFGHTAYGLADLLADLARFGFLLGGDGDRLLDPPLAGTEEQRPSP